MYLKEFKMYFRYISEENLSGNCLVLVDPFLARELDMNIWDFANTSNLIVYPIPRAVCSSMKTFNAGALTRYCTHMLLLISTRCGIGIVNWKMFGIV